MQVRRAPIVNTVIFRFDCRDFEYVYFSLRLPAAVIVACGLAKGYEIVVLLCRFGDRCYRMQISVVDSG